MSLDAPGTARSCPSPPVLVSGHPTEPGAGPAHTRVGIVTSAGCHITDSPPYYLPEPTGKFWEARPGHEQVWTLCCREPATRPSASGSEYRSTPRAGRAEWPQPARSVQWTWRSTVLAPPGSELSHGGRACCPDPDSHPDYELRQAGPHFTAWGLRPVRALGPPAGRSWWGRPRSPGPALSAGVLNPHVGVPVSVCLRAPAPRGHAGPQRSLWEAPEPWQCSAGDAVQIHLSKHSEILFLLKLGF